MQHNKSPHPFRVPAQTSYQDLVLNVKLIAFTFGFSSLQTTSLIHIHTVTFNLCSQYVSLLLTNSDTDGSICGLQYLRFQHVGLQRCGSNHRWTTHFLSLLCFYTIPSCWLQSIPPQPHLPVVAVLKKCYRISTCTFTGVVSHDIFIHSWYCGELALFILHLELNCWLQCVCYVALMEFILHRYESPPSLSYQKNAERQHLLDSL